MNKKLKWLIGLGVLGVLGGLVLHTMSKAGAFRDIEPHTPGPCQRVGGIVGGEDVEWRANGREVFIAAQDRRNLDAAGKIYVLAPGDQAASPRDVTPELDFPFHPHGVSIYAPSGAEPEQLYVVNHRGGWVGPHTIEVFEAAADGSLAHLRTIEGEALVSPNDIVAVGPDEFYVTNDHASGSHFWQTFEDFLQLPLGNVVFFDGSVFTEVYGGTRYANGINTSPDGRELYLAETVGGTVKVFERDPKTHALSLKEAVDVDSGPDNIDLTPDGTVWVAAHPKMLDFLSHADDPDARSPSQALRLRRDESGTWQTTEIYLDDGDPLSGSAVAAVHGETMVVGPVFDPHILVCAFEQPLER